MAVKWGKKGTDASENTSQDTRKPERISNKLDHVVVAESKQAHKFSTAKLAHNKQSWAGLLIVLILLTGGYFMIKEEPKPEPKKAYVSAEGVAIRPVTDEELREEVSRLTFQKKFDSARELIDFQESGGNRDNRLLFTSTYVNQGNHEEAVKSFLAVENNFGADWAVARSIGEQYEELGDKGQALSYYRKSLDLLKQADGVPVKKDEIYFLETNIKRVGG